MKEGTFGCSGGSLRLETSNITLAIPKGAIPEGIEEIITLQAIEDLPDNMSDDDVAVALGCRCTRSSGLARFDKPVELIIPHCAALSSDEEDIKAVLYVRKNDREYTTQLFNKMKLSQK